MHGTASVAINIVYIILLLLRFQIGPVRILFVCEDI